MLDPAITKQVLDKLKDLTVKEESREVEMLSDREREVLALVADGMTNKEIASQLVISGNTARNHVIPPTGSRTAPAVLLVRLPGPTAGRIRA